jgi:hypothetical protein
MDSESGDVGGKGRSCSMSREESFEEPTAWDKAASIPGCLGLVGGGGGGTFLALNSRSVFGLETN